MNRKEYDASKAQLWINAWVAVAAGDVASPEVPTKWADKAVEDFENRFSAQVKEDENTR